jgi:hypothetical protein
MAEEASTTHAATTPRTFHPWPRLPVELQVEILKIMVHRTRPITYRTNLSLAHSADFMSLLHASKTIKSWVYRLHYEKGVILERAPGHYYTSVGDGRQDREDGVKNGYMSFKHAVRSDTIYRTNLYSFQHPKPSVTAMIRRVELRLVVGDDFELWKSPAGRMMSWRPPYGFNEWLLLVRCETGAEQDQHIKWQTTLLNLQSLTLVVTVKDCRIDSDSVTRWSGRCLLDTANGTWQGGPPVDREEKLVNMFTDATTALKPTEITVMVKGMTCDGYNGPMEKSDRTCEHNCSGLIAGVVKAALMRKETE